MPLSARPVSPPILVIGLGNPILGDDGFGWVVAQRLQGQVRELSQVAPLAHPVEFDFLTLGGLSLMERLVGYERVIIIDALSTGLDPPGTVSCLKLDELPEHRAGHLTAAHDVSLQTALRVGRSMGAKLPDLVVVIGVEAEQVYEFSEELTPPVEAAVPMAQQMLMQLLLQPVE